MAITQILIHILLKVVENNLFLIERLTQKIAPKMKRRKNNIK